MNRKALIAGILLLLLFLFSIPVLAAASCVDNIKDLKRTFNGSQVTLIVEVSC